MADTKLLFRWFDEARGEAKNAIENNLPLPAYDFVIFASHVFNTLDARKAISVAQRQDFIQNT